MSDLTCTHPREPLSLYLDGEGSLLLRFQVTWRLRRCAGCRASLAALRGADQWVAGVAVEPPAGMEEALLAKARAVGPQSDAHDPGITATQRVPRWRWLPVAGMAATAAVVVAIGVGRGWWSPRPGDDVLYTDLTLFEEMDLIARLDMVQHFDEIQGVRRD